MLHSNSKRQLLCSIFFALTAIAVINDRAVIADDSKSETAKATVSDAAIAKLITELGDADYQTRQKATRKLLSLGAAAVPSLEKAAESKDLEVMTRAIGILRSHYPTDNDTTELVSDALERLATSKNTSVRTRSLDTLNAFSSLRQTRAVAKIEKLGGGIAYLPESYNPTGKPQVHFVFLGKAWKGGTAGLKYIAQLKALRQLYYTENCELEQKQIEELQVAVPTLEVQRRSEAYLGISGRDNFNQPGCLVGTVQEGKPADQANLRTGDLIVEFGGKRVASFRSPFEEQNSLIKLIEGQEPGDKVEVVYIREGLRRKTTVTLSAWFTPTKRKADG